MTTPCCNLLPQRLRRISSVGQWLFAGAAVALLPKCPACLAGYVAAATGVGISLAAATQLRLILLALSLILLSCLTIKVLRSRQGFPHRHPARVPATTVCTCQSPPKENKE